MKKLTLFFTFFAMLSCSLLAQTGIKNMTLIGQLGYNDNLNDVWAYVDTADNEYALVGTVNGLSIVDLSSPSNPTEIHFISGPNSTWRDIKTYKDFAYVSNETGQGCLIVDLSGLPATINSKYETLGGSDTHHNVWIAEDHLYLVGTDNYNGGMAIYNLANDPWNPQFVGSYTERYVHDVYIRDNMAYSAEINDGLLTVIDVTNKANPTVLGTQSYVNSFTHNTWLNDASDVCFTTDELSEAYIYSWDVSNPSNIKELDKIRSSLSNGQATPHNTHVLNDYLVTSYYKDGVNIIDASRPGNLVEVGYYDTNNLDGGGTDGCWGAYPFLPSGLVLGTDMNEGLFVLAPTYVRGCYLEGTVTEAGSSNPISNVSVDVQTTSITDMSKTTGDYAVGLADAGSYTVTYAKFGYLPATETVSLSNGVVTIKDVQLTQAPTISYEITVLEDGTNQPIGGADVVASTQGALFDYVTNSNGIAFDNALVAGNYDIIAGKWGYVTSSVNVNAVPGNATITVYLRKGYYDDYVFDNFWKVFGNATTGMWVRAEPVGTSYFGFPIQTDFDLQSDFGENCYVTGNSSQNVGGDDVDDGTTILESPVMDLSTYSDPYMTYSYWFIHADLNQQGPGNDYFAVEVSDGITTKEVARYEGLDNQWTTDSIRLTDHITLTNNVKVRFITLDVSPGHIVEAAVDQFTIFENAVVSIDPELAAQVDFTLYPNPASDLVNLSYELPQSLQQGQLSYELYDIKGRLLSSSTLDARGNQYQLDVSGYTPGVYVGVLRHDGKAVQQSRLIIQ